MIAPQEGSPVLEWPPRMTTDHSNWPTRRIALADEGREPALAGLTPGQMVEMVWTLTLEAWTFKDGTQNEPRLRRDVASVVRSRT